MSVSKYKISEVQSCIPTPIDVFICCGSYESRCLSIASNIDASLVGKALIAENKDLSIHVGENSGRLRTLFPGKVIDVAISSRYPITTADEIKSALEKVKSVKPLKYIVDVTTFTHEGLLILLRLLKLNLKKSDEAIFVYTSASDYSIAENEAHQNQETDKEKVEDKWLSKGVFEVRSVLGYSGENLPSHKTHLIILVGFEYERASKLIEAFEPDTISLGYGRPGSETSQKHKIANQYFHKLVHETAATHTRVMDFEFSCCNPWDARDAILKQVKEAPDCNAFIAPMNTKISTIGTALAAFKNEAIQLCYAQAKVYNYKHYSYPGETFYLFNLPELFE